MTTRSGHTDTFARDRLPAAEQWPTLLLGGIYDYPDRLNAVTRLLDDAIDEGHGEQTAIISPSVDGLDFDELTYAQLQRRVDALAHVLIDDLGLVPGNRVLLRSANSPMLAVAWLAVFKAGMIAVGTMPLLRAKELTAIVDKAHVQAALCDAALVDELLDTKTSCPQLTTVGVWGTTGDGPGQLVDVQAAMATKSAPFTACDTAADDIALIAFTSGTTGEPKGCIHFHRDVLAMCDGFAAQCVEATAGDRFIGTPPLAFTFGLGGLLAFPLAARASTVLVERTTPKGLLDVIGRTRSTVAFTAPTFYRQMAAALTADPSGFDTSSLRVTVSAGEALPNTTRVAWRNATGIEMLDGIGATEMIHIFIATPTTAREGTIGTVVPGFEARIVDDEMNDVPTGTIGRLAVRGPVGCRYLADSRQSVYVRDGWNLTGDAFCVDADGYFSFSSRTDDMIVSAGYNIAAPEVEDALMAHPAVAECAVIGQPDPDRGQIVKAFVVRHPDTAVLDPDVLVPELQAFVRARIAPYKYPRAIEFLDSLPRTETGKLQRFKLKTEPTGKD
jgi:2-aminobenzoate-CoA ligase